MTVSPDHSLLYSGGESSQSEAFTKGLRYLHRAANLALEPGMVDVMHNLRDRSRICIGIGEQIDRVNADLYDTLNACHECFYVQQRRPIQILAVPLSSGFGVDAFCNIAANPIAILIDVGRVAAEDWLAVIAHEYAHAHLGHPGHNHNFLDALSHLCLGLGLAPPNCDPGITPGVLETQLRSWPHCPALVDPLAFWRGLAGV